MKDFRIKKYLKYVYGIAFFLFFLNKFYLRPWIVKNDVPGFLTIVTYSIPNLIEAIIGTILVTGILLYARHRYNKKLGTIGVSYIHSVAVFLAGFFVLTQELKIHNLGGDNLYDPFDLIASVIGLTGTFLAIQLLGFTE